MESDSSVASIEAAPSSVRVHQFADVFMDQQVYFLLLTMDKTLFIWVGNSSKQLANLHLSVPARIVRVPTLISFAALSLLVSSLLLPLLIAASSLLLSDKAIIRQQSLPSATTLFGDVSDATSLGQGMSKRIGLSAYTMPPHSSNSFPCIISFLTRFAVPILQFNLESFCLTSLCVLSGLRIGWATFVSVSCGNAISDMFEPWAERRCIKEISCFISSPQAV
jgi:hypothetical protein